MKSQTFSTPVSLLVLALVAGQLLLKTTALDPITPESSSGASETVNMTLVRETQALIAEGDRNIELDPRKRNLTLLLGITGSGKSTMAQLITRATNGLEAYKKSEDADTLIRDTAKRISQSSNTLKSHTLFPELVTDEETLEAMYDCPGFQDTRSTSVEIAIGFFIKKLVEHAQNIRLLVIVKHDAMKSGGSRFWFTSLMTQLLSFSKSFKNYRGGIALLATKMEAREYRVVPKMANFLGESYEHMLEKWPERKEDIDILFGSWLQRDAANESYVNLDYFVQPVLEGKELSLLLSEMPSVVANRQRIRQMIFNNTYFTHQKCHPEDFGIPLSFEAISNIQKMDAMLKDQVARGVGNVSHFVQEKFGQVAFQDRILPPATFATVMKASERAKNATSAQQVSQVLLDLVRPFGLYNVTAMIPELTEKVKVRQYFQKLVPPTQGDGAAAEYVELLKTIVLGVAKSAEERVRSRFNSVVNQVFSEANGNIVGSMQNMSKTSQIEVLETIARVLNGCNLNAYDFAACVRKIGDFNTNPHTARFGLNTETLEIVSKLNSMLRTDGVWSPDLQKASFLSNLKLGLEKFGELVGQQAGVYELFPVGHNCVA